MSSLRAHRVSFSFSTPSPSSLTPSSTCPRAGRASSAPMAPASPPCCGCSRGRAAAHGRAPPARARHAVIRLCPQSVEALSPEITRLRGRRTTPWRGGCSGSSGWTPRPWSAGPRCRPASASAGRSARRSASEPDVLLLDEPTNHLDAEARALAHRRAAPLPRRRRRRVARPRAAGDPHHGHAARATRARRACGPGAYSAAREGWEAEREATTPRTHRGQEAHRRVQQQLAQARREEESASAARSTGKRMKNKYDSDARTLGAAKLAEWAEAGQGRRVGVLRREAERAADALGEFQVDKTLGRSVFVDYVRSPNPLLFTLDVPSLRAGDMELLGPVNLSVGRESRIRIEGPNGAGKSTLLRALLDQRARAAGAGAVPAPGRERGGGRGGAGVGARAASGGAGARAVPGGRAGGGPGAAAGLGAALARRGAQADDGAGAGAARLGAGAGRAHQPPGPALHRAAGGGPARRTPARCCW